MKTFKPITGIIISIVIAAGLAGCRSDQTQPTEISTEKAVSPTAAPADTEESAPPPTEDAVSAETQLEGGLLDSEGPWMMIEAGEGFWFVGAQGNQSGVINIPPQFTSGSAQPAPGGGLVGLVFSEFSKNVKVLQVFSLPENQVIYEQDLLAYDGESLSFEGQNEAEEFELDRKTAVGRLAWSSDGKQLAFVSSHLGPSPDVYILDIESGEVNQISSEPSHEVGLNWSPGDAYLFYAGVDKLHVNHTGSGFSGWKFYAARPDGSEILVAGEGMQNRGGEAVLGWYSENQALMTSSIGTCGTFDLRLLNIETGETQMVWEGLFDEFAYAPESKRVMVWLSLLPPKTDDCGTKSAGGLYSLALPTGTQKKIKGFSKDIRLVTPQYSEAGGVFKVGIFDVSNPPTWLTVDKTGKIEDFNLDQPFFSPDGSSYALVGLNAGSLVVIGVDGQEDTVVWEGEVLFPTWTPDGSGLFYFNREGSGDFSLYYWTQTPDAQSVQIAGADFENVEAEPVWVLP